MRHASKFLVFLLGAAWSTTAATAMTRFLTATLAAVGLVALLVTAPTQASAQPPLQSFGVLAGSTVTNTGASVITGNVGLSPGSAITGFPPGIVVSPFTIHNTDAVASLAQNDLTAAYNILQGRPTTVGGNLTGQDLGSRTLTAGVYNFDSSAQLTGTLTLDGGGNTNSIFIFNIGSTLTTASASKIVLTNGAQGANVFFRVGSSATLGTTTTFWGDILALTSITLTTDATITCGGALARNGAVTLDTNTIVSAAASPCALTGSTLPITFQILNSTLSPTEQAAALTQLPAELAAALPQLSGEAGASVAPSGIQATNSFLSLVLNSGFDSGRFGPGVVTAPAASPAPAQGPVPGSGTVKALDYGPEDSPNRVGSVFAAFDRAPPIPRRYDVWAAAFGGQDNTEGNASAGTHDTVARDFGFAAGLDYRVTPDTTMGVALSTGGTSFGLSDNLGSGSSNMYQAAVYSRTNFNAAYLAAALAFAWYDESTDRFITVGGNEHLSAEFAAHDIAGQIEAGYRLGWLTPYAALRVQSFYTPAYAETSDLGASVFALNYAARTTTDTRTEIGARIDRTIALPDGDSLGLRVRAAWAHDFWSNRGAVATFQSIPGVPFIVNGATPPSDSFLFSGGGEIRFRNGFSLASWVDTAFARGFQSYAGNVRLRYAW